MTQMQQLAKLSGKSLSRVYQIARELGRTPTLEELMVNGRSKDRKYGTAELKNKGE